MINWRIGDRLAVILGDATLVYGTAIQIADNPWNLEQAIPYLIIKCDNNQTLSLKLDDDRLIRICS